MKGLPRTLLTGLVLGLVSPLLLAVAPAPAGGHPFGDPQTLMLSVDGDELVVQWRAGGLDDLTLLGISLGLLPEDRVLLDGAVDVRPEDPAVLAASPAFADYLTERIEIVSGGEPCPLRLADASGLGEDGARLVASCPGSGSVRVTSTMLTDLHPQYRLLASGPGGQRAQYDADHPTHTWTFTDSGTTPEAAAPAADTGLGRSAVVQIGAVLAVGGLLAMLALAVVRRRHDRIDRAA